MLFAAASNAHGTVAVGINVSITYMKSAKSGLLTAEAREVAFIIETRQLHGQRHR